MPSPVNDTISSASGAGIQIGFGTPLGSTPIITTQPSSALVSAGGTATFTVVSSGTGLSYQWQRSVDNGVTWNNIAGATLATYITPVVTVTGGSANNGDVYRVRVTNASGTTVSNTATLTVASIGSNFTTISVVNQSATAGTYPYYASLFPLQGQVPSNATIASSDDTNLVGTVYSTWPDGSAAIIIATGTVTLSANQTRSLNVGTIVNSGTTNLTPSAINSLLTSLQVNFGTGYGTANLTNFSNPERIWWASSRNICARFVLTPPTPGGTSLEALIDIHAWQDRLFIEVVVENGKMNSTTPVQPAGATYDQVVVTVNGTNVATVTPASSPEPGTHSRFRAWYASTWVGQASPVRATQSHLDLQKHPLLFVVDKPASFDMNGYASDAYTPWSAGRQNSTNMGGTGDFPGIGPLTQWDTRWLQSGDFRAARAVEASALAALGFNINYRDATTGQVTTFSQIGTRSIATGTWPALFPAGSYNFSNGAFGWEGAHAPAVGLIAFMCRPSPVFVEIAQKAATWQGAWSASNNGTVVIPGGWTAGVAGQFYQVRGKAWTIRNIAHAAFLSSNTSGWRIAALEALAKNAAMLDAYRLNAANVLKWIWGGSPAYPDDQSGGEGINFALWENHFLVTELHKFERTRLLSGSDQTTLTSVTNWLCEGVVDWVTDQPLGGWRYLPYRITHARTAELTNEFPDWQSQRNRVGNMTDLPVATGTWMTSGGNPTTYAAYEADTVGGFLYVEPYWTSLVAAYERDTPLARQAFSTVESGITNLSTWRNGFASDPRWGAWPINYVASGFAAGTETGTVVNDLWTPAKTGDIINAASWNIVPTGRWIRWGGSNVQALYPLIQAALPGHADQGTNGFSGIMTAYNGFAIDRTRTELILAAAGGHAQCSDNGVYSWSPFRGNWQIEKLPSSSVNWDPYYKNSKNNANVTYTVDPQSDALYQAAIANNTDTPVGGYFYDELVFDRQPTSRHTYSSQVVVPETNEIVMSCRRMWHFDRVSKQWTFKRTYPPAPFSPVDGAGIYGEWDQYTKEALFFGNADGHRKQYSWNPATKTFGVWSLGSTNISTLFGAANTRHGDVWSFCTFPAFTWSGVPGQDASFVQYNIATRTVTRPLETVQYGGGLSRSDFARANWYYDGAGMAYIPSLNRFWLVGLTHTGVRWFQIDPTTSPATISPLTFVNAPPDLDSQIQRKVIYFQELNALVVFMTTDNGWVYKF